MSRKAKTIYICESCGHQELKWVGKCPVCEAWGTLTEEQVVGTLEELGELSSHQQPRILNEVAIDASVRISAGGPELDRLLGGGIVAGSVMLLVGDPGIGKSTLSLSMAGNIGKTSGRVLYVSGEESAEQTKMRADRLGDFPDTVYVVAETNLELVQQHIHNLQPKLVVLDSIQSAFLPAVRATPGSPSQIKECTLFLIRIAKELGIPVIMIGQVTKDSQLAGPRVLEHLVDTVVYLEGNRSQSLRIGRVVKNRFGSTNEVALFEMTSHGFEEVVNPSEYLLGNRSRPLPGSVIVASGRGTRSIFTEIQALVTPAPEGIPPRQIAVGVDRNRLLLVTAVLQRWLGERLGNKNIFVSTGGGIDSDDPALDLGIAASIVSSVRGITFDNKLFFIGELALSGEVRPTPDLGKLLTEGARLGFRDCVIAKAALGKVPEVKAMNLFGLEHIGGLLKLVPAIVDDQTMR